MLRGKGRKKKKMAVGKGKKTRRNGSIFCGGSDNEQILHPLPTPN